MRFEGSTLLMCCAQYFDFSIIQVQIQNLLPVRICVCMRVCVCAHVLACLTAHVT